MIASTMTMPPVYEQKATFPRSHSSPSIPDLVHVDYKRQSSRLNEELPRSASFTTLPLVDAQYTPEKELQRYESAGLPAERQQQSPKKSEDEKKKNRPSKEERPKLERMGRRKSFVARPKSWIQKVRGSPERQSGAESINTTPIDAPPMPHISRAIRDSKSRTVSASFAAFSRKSWITSSRSPSPRRNTGAAGTTVDNVGDEGGKAGGDGTIVVVSAAKLETPPPAKLVAESAKVTTGDSPQKPPLLRAPTTKPRSRPQSVFLNFTPFASANSSRSSLPRSSLDNTSTPRTSTDKVPPLPKNFSTDKLHSDTPKRRDELWSAFRSIENDFSKFQSKSWSLKTNVVRVSLLPFLRNHAEHPSNKTLRPEDLDRRIIILNKWWTGLLEVLDGRQNQTVSGVDRPILLDACYAIMTRPEWRLSPSVFAPLADRSSNRSPERRAATRKKSSASLSSSASQFMIESVYHNVRNLFIQNLLTQMAFVVDKMSLRHAPASLVTFCGKAAAYAFFFVPSIADMMVRIWKLPLETMRRASDELGMPRISDKVTLDEFLAPFPAHLQCLGWKTAKSMSSQLRKNPVLQVLAAKINWHGPWVARWCGRDSDLFFVFVKHYHLLTEEFMQPELSMTEKARAPGFVLVQAQILTALDATIHRQPAAEPMPITFDDVLAGADASASALPLPSNNSARPMAENRLIMLLRDFISEKPSNYEDARMTFAKTFSKMMQATAKRTSLFDHSACFVLCDFMEEALSLFVRFHYSNGQESDFIDWHFWLDVCKKMMSSQNTMSEIRLISFLYGTWNLVTSNETRKQIMCLEWLVEEETFDKFFNHWCPMVRAYYMRLLCWRLCRDDGEASDLDTKIFNTCSIRIKSTWAHYLHLRREAELSQLMPPSIAPCHPAPGRRLLIIRNDNQSPAANLFLGFDGIVNSSAGTPGTTQATPYKRHSSLASLTKMDPPQHANPTPSADPILATPPTKKRWTFMAKILPSSFTSQSATSDPAPSAPGKTPGSPTKTLEEARAATALARARPTLHSKHSSSGSETPPATSTHRSYSFKFSLEWAQHFEPPAKQTYEQNSPFPTHNVPGNRNSLAGSSRGRGESASPERRVTPPRLPAPAQAWIGAKVPGTSREIVARDPIEDGIVRATRAKYSGRALAEWALIVGECNCFVERRRGEGVPGLKWMEVPTLSVEGFRRFG